MELLKARSEKSVSKDVTWSMFSLLLYTYPQGNPPILGTTAAVLLNMAWEGSRVVVVGGGQGLRPDSNPVYIYIYNIYIYIYILYKAI